MRPLEIDEAGQHPATNRLGEVAIRLNNLGQLLQATNRLGEAEPLMRRALEIDEASFGKATPGGGRGQMQGERWRSPTGSRDLNNLGQLLQATNRLGKRSR